MKIVDYENGHFIISFNNTSKEAFYETLAKVKTLTGRSYKDKLWKAPAIETNLDILVQEGFIFSVKAKEYIRNLYRSKPERILPEVDKSQLKGLFPFQIEGVQFLSSRQGHGIISDQMGLGKTIQALGYLKLHPELRPALVICPASLKLNWQREINKWLPEESIQILSGRNPDHLMFGINIYIINYDILGIGEVIIKNGKKKTILKGGWFSRILNEENIKIIIADEIQYISNHKAIRTIAFIETARKIKKVIGLSGTPIKNRPSEFFTILNLIEPKVFPNRWNYLQTFCNPKNNGFGWTFKGLTNGKELYRLIYPLMIRREKKDVLKDLPDKIKTVIPLEVNQADFRKYEKMYEEVFNKIENMKVIEKRGNYEKLKQMAYACKRESVLNWIDDFISTGEKLVLFSYHRAVLDDIEEKFKNISVRIDGSVNIKLRQERVDQFQLNENIKIFSGQIQAAGIGINLTVASSVAFVEFGWNPADHEQAEDRCHRIGQSECVNAYYLVAVGTIENKIVELLIEKGKMLGQVLDGKEKDFFSEDILEVLMKGENNYDK